MLGKLVTHMLESKQEVNAGDPPELSESTDKITIALTSAQMDKSAEANGQTLFTNLRSHKMSFAKDFITWK